MMNGTGGHVEATDPHQKNATQIPVDDLRWAWSMTRAEITGFWGPDNLARWSEAGLREVAIPDSAKSFLVEVGMPVRVDWTLRFAVPADEVARATNAAHCI